MLCHWAPVSCLTPMTRYSKISACLVQNKKTHQMILYHLYPMSMNGYIDIMLYPMSISYSITLTYCGLSFCFISSMENYSTLFPLILCCSLILYLWHHFASLLMAACMCTRCMSVFIEDFHAGSLVHMGPFDLTVLDIINNILYHQHIVRQDKVQTSSCMVTLISYMMMP